MPRQGDLHIAAAIASALAIDADDAARFAETAAVETVRPRGTIDGDALVARGAVKLVMGDVVIDMLRAPHLALAAPFRYVARRSCLVARLNPAVIVAHPAAVAGFWSNVAASLAERIEARAAPTVEARLEHLLEGLARRHGTRVSGGTFLALPLRGRDAASLAGTTTETVSRIFAAWKRTGRIRATRDGVWIRGS